MTANPLYMADVRVKHESHINKEGGLVYSELWSGYVCSVCGRLCWPFTDEVIGRTRAKHGTLISRAK